MSPFVFLAPGFIALALAIPILFEWHRALRKKIGHNFVAALAAMLLTAVSISVVYVVVASAFFAMATYYPDDDFDRLRWLAEKEKRFELSEDLIESRMLIGKTKAEVKQLLGDEGNEEQSNYWQYYLGYRPTIMGIDPDVLDIYFEDGKVTRVEQHQT